MTLPNLGATTRGLLSPSTLGDFAMNGADPAAADLAGAPPAFVTGATGDNSMISDIVSSWFGGRSALPGPTSLAQSDATSTAGVTQTPSSWWNAQPWTVQTAFILLGVAVVVVGLLGIAFSTGAAQDAAKAAAA